jgi:hypothetical protein
MQHKVPQFIEVEDKIFGPFTLKQFSYLAGGFGLSIIIWRTFSDSSFVLFYIAPVVAFSLALTFLKPNGKPFIALVQSFLTFLIKPKKLFWKNPGVDESPENRKYGTEYVQDLKRAEDSINKGIGELTNVDINDYIKETPPPTPTE